MKRGRGGWGEGGYRLVQDTQHLTEERRRWNRRASLRHIGALAVSHAPGPALPSPNPRWEGLLREKCLCSLLRADVVRLAKA